MARGFILALLAGVLCFQAVAVAGDVFNYGDAVDLSFLFLEAQRSGKLPADHRVKWRGDSGLKDGLAQGVNLVGGYYDAGDHVKFGLPMAFVATILSWGAIDFNKEITDLNQMDNTLNAIKWAADYFIKAHPQRNVLWGQVGDGASDHFCWERPEDMTTPRTAFKIDESHPGSDLAGETAAALAAASIAFKTYNSSYSDLLLVHAKELFTFADTFRGLYDDSIPCASEFYSSSGYWDELLWAAAWLFRATGDEYYLKYTVDKAVSFGGTGWAMKEFSWDNKYAGVQVLLTKVLLEGRGGAYTTTLKQYQAKADYFACACLQKNDGFNINKTPGGLMYVREWNNMQYASAAAFLIAVYSVYLSEANAKLICPDGVFQPHDLLNFAQSQADYILGNNPNSISYLVGYGSKFPQKLHHRGSSIPSIFTYPSTIGCVQGFDSWYHRLQQNPNILHGALVGGPDKNDRFDDDRSDYEQTEPTLTACAPLIGLFSKLQSVNGNPGSRGYKPPVKREEESPKTNAPVPVPAGCPVEFIHTITSTWAVGKEDYYRHQVKIKNTSGKPISGLKLRLENLSGPIWGLSPTQQKDIYELPQWMKVLQPASEFNFIYIQGGPQATVTVSSYH
ncbi:endoglucanase 5 [Momordica charantia]|uniref:Endoglucanase n=1 Tax=Momordica charantia TaxID=3673 RepID=A0A6J1DNC1_MOMCH|nr:endoglucanase 5 [Momordica charantia]